MKPNYLSRPKQITQGENPSIDALSFIGLPQELNYLTARACERLKHPVTIIDLETEERIDSESQFYALRPTCRLLRHCAGKKECYNCDMKFASLFKNLTKENIYRELKKKTIGFKDFFIEQHGNIVYIRYRCPMLGYWEMVFPILYGSNVIGVLFVGQTLINDPIDLAKAKDIRQKYLDVHATRLFRAFTLDYVKKNLKIITTKDIKEKILNLKDDLPDPILLHNFYKLPNSVASMTIAQDDFDSLIRNACEEVGNIEKGLRGAMREKRISFFDDALNNLLIAWYKAKNDVGTIWPYFMNVIKGMKITFGFKNVYVFGDGKISSATTAEVKRRLKSNGIAQEAEMPCFDFSRFDSNERFDRLEANSSLHNPGLINGLCGNIAKDDIVLLAFPNLVVAFEVDSLATERETYDALFASIAKKLTEMNTRLELLTIGFLKEHHELTLRTYRHETAHIAERLSDRNRRYLASDEDVKKLTGSKRKDVYEDFRSSISLVSNMALTIGIVLDRLSEDEKELAMEEPVSVFKELLYKWEAMFSDKLEIRNLEIVVPPTSRLDPMRPDKIKINRYLFELLVFNLVDNAVKYAYRGTSIFLDCIKEGSSYYLKVISLGPKIVESDEPYGLYERGEAEDHDIDVLSGRVAGGDGLGLFVVKRISELLNLQVSHSCPQNAIAKYNVPLVEWYLDMVPVEQQDHDLVAKLRTYSHPYKQHPDFNDKWFSPKNEIVKSDLSVDYLCKRINSRIYKTTFEVLIPISREI